MTFIIFYSIYLFFKRLKAKGPYLISNRYVFQVENLFHFKSTLNGIFLLDKILFSFRVKLIIDLNEDFIIDCLLFSFRFNQSNKY